MTEYNPTVEEVKDEVEGEVDDFDEDEWEAKLEEYEPKFGKFGDDDFVAWAVAYVEYGVQIAADYSLPGGGSSGGSSSGLPDDVESYKLENLDEVDRDNDEQIEVAGYVMGMRDDVSSNNNPQKKLYLRDDTSEELVMGTGESIVEAIDATGIEVGDYVKFQGAQVFRGEDDEGNPTDFYAVTLPPWTEISFPDPEYGLDTIAKDYVNDIVNEGDFVYVSGLVTDKQVNKYDGCGQCMKKWDPDENRVCPNCNAGEEEIITYEPGSLKVTSGGTTATVSFSPSDEWPEPDDPDDDLIFSEVEAYGEYSTREYDGTEYKEIEVTFTEIVDGIEEDPVGDSVEDAPQDETEDETGDIPEPVRDIQEKVENFGHEMPAQAGIRILNKSHGITDEDDQVEMMKHLRGIDSIEVREDEDEGITIENKEWKEVMLEEAN